MQVAHYERGIGKYSESKAGENNFLQNYLKKIFEGYENYQLVMFDAGANTGDYSLNLQHAFPGSAIFSFEPNPSSFEILQRSVEKCPEIIMVNSALGEKKSTQKMFTHADQPYSQQASIVPGVIEDLQQATSVLSFNVGVVDLDSFCKTNGIDRINFLKIDTEGYDLQVIKGAASLIEKGKIDVIQFEINEMNLYARVFLKDFYALLKGYEFYRMDTNKIIPLGNYEAANEIFLYQNIIAIRQNIIADSLKNNLLF